MRCSKLNLLTAGSGAALLAWFVIRSTLLGSIPDNVRPFQFAYVVGFAGYFLLCISVVRSTTGGSVGRWGWWLLVCVVLRVPLVTMEPSDDVYRYVWEGRIQLAGINPYQVAPDDPSTKHLRDDGWSMVNHKSYPAIYPPLAQMEFLAAALLHPSIYTVKALHAIWDLLTIVVLGSCLRRLGRAPHAALVYGLCPLVLTAFASEGHIDSLMLLLVALFVLAEVAGRGKLAGVALGAAMAAKLLPVVFLPWLARRRPMAAVVAVAVFGCLYTPYLGAGAALFGSLHRFGSGDEFLSVAHALYFPLLIQPDIRRGIAMVLLGVVLGILAWRSRNLLDFAPRAVTSLLLLMPVVHYWYLAFAVMFVPITRRVAWLVASVMMVGYFDAWLAQRTLGEWMMPRHLGVAVWAAWTCTWLVEWFVANRTERDGAKKAAPAVGSGHR